MSNGLVQVTIQVHSNDRESHPAEMQRVGMFLMAGVEVGTAAIFGDVQSFDPRTGEPIVAVPFPDMEAAELISAMTVMSPTAQVNAFSKMIDNYAATHAEGQIVHEPIIMGIQWED